jgi:5-deoxy-glucuronate isomerase
MAKHHFLPAETLKRLEPADMGLVYTSLQRLELGNASVHSDTEETCLVVIQGQVAYKHGNNTGKAVLCDMLYLPPGETLELSGEKAAAIRYGAPCTRKTGFAHIRFEDVDKDGRHKVYGNNDGGTKRDVWNFINEDFDSSRFLIGICYGGKGSWTAWPPHEHGAKREEVYIYFGMGDGFALQCVYQDLEKQSETFLVRDGHLVAIPGGYHPNVGCPKTGIRYIYCMVSTTAEDRNFMDLKIQSQFGDKLE